mgnify:CR=1 FL=1
MYHKGTWPRTLVVHGKKRCYNKSTMTTYVENKKAAFDYEILEKYEAGLVLSGMEVKSIRAGHISLKGAFITFHGNNAMLTNAHIAKYKYSGKSLGYEPEKSRQILLKKRENNHLRGKMQEKGLTVIPLSVYTKGRHIKMEIAVCRGKKKYDKRESIKKREIRVEMARELTLRR